MVIELQVVPGLTAELQQVADAEGKISYLNFDQIIGETHYFQRIPHSFP
jgi:hypothetical protein